MIPALRARMPRLGLAASCSPSPARLPRDVLTASPVRLSIASLCDWSIPASSWPMPQRWPHPRGAHCIRAGRLHVADKQGCLGVLGLRLRAPPRSSFSAAGGARSAP